jgi:hypothetical protein
MKTRCPCLNALPKDNSQVREYLFSGERTDVLRSVEEAMEAVRKLHALGGS